MKDETSKGVQLVGPVEELSDLQWARIERGMWQRLDAETADAAMRAATDAGEADEAAREARAARHRASLRRPWKIAAMAAGVLAAAAIAFAVWPRGAEQVAAIGGEPRPGEPARVVTSDSATTVSFADAAIEVQPHSAVLMSGSADRGATVVLESGRAGFHVAPRDHRRPFVVMAGHALVRVVGTRFEVSRNGEAVSVQVKEGIVDVRFLGEVHQVTAGQEWHSQAASAPLTPVPVPVPGDAAAVNEEATSATADRVVPKPVKPRPPAREPDDSKPDDSKPDDSGPDDSGPDDSARIAREEAAAAQAAARARAAEFTAAAKLESSAPQQALKQYLEMAKQNDRWAQNALYAAARLALDVGQRARAAELAQAYLRRFPQGPNAEDARSLLDALP